MVLAEENCNVLKTSPHFTKCHSAVDVGPYYTKCVQDMCHCPGDPNPNPEVCMCEALANYARQCALKSVYIDWRTPNLCREYNCVLSGFGSFYLNKCFK